MVNLGHIAQQLSLKDVFALLVLLRALIRLIVFPPDDLVTLSAVDVTHDVPACGHVALDGFGGGDVHDGIEEIGFAVLATEVLCGAERLVRHEPTRGRGEAGAFSKPQLFR
jgi:hypothetical protein